MKLLVVDDDEQIREGIEKGINWSEMGICEVKSASNGIEALETIKTFLPEIVLTDVRMPEMDGLELFKRIKDMKPSTKVVIISGYSDFDYLKTAIQYGAADYELKPIRVKSLIALIKRLKEDILKEKSTEENFIRYQKTYVGNFMESLLTGKIVDRNIILEELEQYFGFDARGPLLLVLFEPDSDCNGSKVTYTNYFDKIKQYFGQRPEGSYNLLFWKINDTRTMLVIKTVDSMLQQQYLISEIIKTTREINRNLEVEPGMTLSLGISNAGCVSGLSTLYGEASEALEYKFYTGKRSVNLYKQINISAAPYKMTTSSMGMLNRAITELDLNAAFESIEREFEILKTLHNQNRKNVSDFCLELMKFLNSTLKSKGYKTMEQYEEDIAAYANFADSGTLEECKNRVMEYYRAVITDLSDEKRVVNNKKIVMAVEYIKKNYNKDLTVESVANYIDKSPNYFSHVFKKDMQMSFTEYLNRLRIRKAKELFLSTDKLVYEVCREVGYQDYAYFAQLFRRFENCTPTEVKRNPQ